MEIREIDIDKIIVSQFNARKDLTAGTEDSTIEELAESIKRQGLLSPITVLKKADGTYELIAGQRRLLACKRIGMKTILAMIRDDISEADATAISLIENVHRADMNPMDKARAFKLLLDKYQSMDKVAEETSVSISTIRRYISLLNLAPSLQQKVNTTEGVAGVEALSTLARTFRPEEQEDALKSISGFKQSVQVEILKRSEGDIEKLEELREQALEGAFDTEICREGLCFKMSEEMKRIVRESLVEQEKFNPEEFKKRIKELL